ncbi:MAG: hypothetical protein ABIS06_22170 [Vicinamibacterales bacterium]
MRLLTSLALSTVLFAGQGTHERKLTKEQGERFQTKLGRIVKTGETPRSKSRAPQSTQITDAELNSYLRFQAADRVPPGIVAPIINAQGEGKVSGSATVDLDAVRKQKQRGWLDPMGYLTGRLPLTARGRLVTQNGVGRFELESAELSGVTIPKTLLQELLSYYSKTPADADGINMDDPFQLPAQIQEIRVASGTATIVQ